MNLCQFLLSPRRSSLVQPQQHDGMYRNFAAACTRP